MTLSNTKALNISTEISERKLDRLGRESYTYRGNSNSNFLLKELDLKLSCFYGIKLCKKYPNNQKIKTT